jgi:hypothetical protein
MTHHEGYLGLDTRLDETALRHCCAIFEQHVIEQDT